MVSDSVIKGGDYFDASSKKADLNYIFETVHGTITLGDFGTPQFDDAIDRMAKRNEIFGVWKEVVSAIRSVQQMKRNINNGGSRVISGLDMQIILVRSLFKQASDEFANVCFSTPFLEAGWERKLLCWMSDSRELRGESDKRLFLYLMCGLEYEQVSDLSNVPESYLLRLAAGVPANG